MTPRTALVSWLARARHDAATYRHIFGPSDRACHGEAERLVSAIPAGEAEYVGVLILDLVGLGALDDPRIDTTAVRR